MKQQKIEILLVEDNPGDAYLLQDQLQQTDTIQFNLIHVNCLEKAIATLDKTSFNIILLDLILPDSRGLETFLQIQATNPHIPIILLTGMDDKELATKAVRQGAQDYLIKGQTSGELIVRSIRYAIQRKQNQEQLEQHILELEGFSYMVSHDLNNPLNVIKSVSSLLHEKYTTSQSEDREEETEFVGYILESCLRMERIIKDLLVLSKVEHKQLEIQPVNINAMMQQIICRIQKQQPERQVKFIIAPNVIACGDPNLLNIALENLLNNAWKYTAMTNKPCIEFGIFSWQNKSRKLQSSLFKHAPITKEEIIQNQPVYFVRDNGIGFDPQKAAKLFTPFQRLHDKNQFPGTGIGLAIVKRIIKQHGGTIWFDAQIGRGATFYFILGKDREYQNILVS